MSSGEGAYIHASSIRLAPTSAHILAAHAMCGKDMFCLDQHSLSIERSRRTHSGVPCRSALGSVGCSAAVQTYDPYVPCLNGNRPPRLLPVCT